MLVQKLVMAEFLEFVVSSTKNSANRSGHFDISLDVQIIYDFEFDQTLRNAEFDVTYPNKEVFVINLTNTGNIDAEVLIFKSESFRGWNILLSEVDESDMCEEMNDDFICEVDVGQTVGIEVTIRTPSGAKVADSYKFTLSAEPVETGVVDRVNIEFTANGDVTPGLFGLGIQAKHLTNGFYGLFVILFVAIAYRSLRISPRS